MSVTSQPANQFAAPNDTGGRSSAFRELARDIKLSHSVFAMPFALLAAVMARSDDAGWAPWLIKLGLVVVCMVAARTAAMLSNRILDRTYDADNPRTAQRALVSGRVAVRDAISALIGSSALFLVCTAVFGFAFDNWWPLLLSMPVLFWICAYPLLKRVTWLCHLYLGTSLAISPLAAAIAIRPESVFEHASLWLLSGFVLGWVAGFDVIYALQDVEVDRQQSLHSVPSRLGVAAALWISRVLHILCVCVLALVCLQDTRFGYPFWLACGLVAAVLIVEHVVIRVDRTAGRIQLAFFTLNGIISCVVGLVGIIDVTVI
ncbi:MAG: 4-hydroxybenzoate octaprenyltransferase [Planctomycetes bacterium]|nr:4-hydroxybenzoate octaprenyltransferase [Planctomycetota bacterium]NOG53378.1 4-hydroxybenzoate octaprenyltransferase [Planctomycetota bacterium]